MTLSRRVSRLESLQGEQAREPGQPFWWELPEDQWRLGAVALGHEEALDLLNAEDGAEGGGETEGDAA